MIPQAFITEWREVAPWITNAQIEQDLILSRALIELYSNQFLANSLAFRGGTALNKLYINPAARYSEDIDLVQIKEGPIGSVLENIRQTLDPWLGKHRWKQNMGRATFIYRFESEIAPVTPMRLKVEINTREHLTVFGSLTKSFKVSSRWFSGEAQITTYILEELLGTKLRALFQRKKGRDLFDLCISFKSFPMLNPRKIIDSFTSYMQTYHSKISKAEFEENLILKLNDNTFLEEIFPLLPIENSIKYDPEIEAVQLLNNLIALIPGEPWKKPKES